MSMATEKFILAIDLGTSGPKVALVTSSGALAGCEVESTDVIFKSNGGAEQDPDIWWKSITTAVSNLFSKFPGANRNVEAICVTTQWSGTVAVDRDGNHLMNAIIWMDSRGAPYIQQIVKGPINFDGYGIDKLLTWVRLTAGVPGQSGKDPIAHILYIKHCLPEIYKATYKFLEPKDYLNMRLTGKFAASYDSIALHWVTDNRDINAICYNDRLIRMSTIDPDKMPDLKPAVDILGPIKPEIAAQLGLNPDVKVVMGTPDVQSAAIGSGAVQDGQLHLYVGTSSWLSGHVPYKKTDVIHQMVSLPSAIPGRYFIANEQETSGACLAFLYDQLICPDDEFKNGPLPEHKWDLINQAASKVAPGSDKVIFTPWLYGERTPIENHSIRGGFHNITLQTTRRHLVRAVMEGVAFNAKWLLDCVKRFVGQPIEQLNIIGGGANSDLWCQIYADVFGCKILQIEDPVQANTRGAAFLALLALKRLRVEDIGGLTRVKHTYDPDPKNANVYQELFKEFINIYKSTRRIYGRLNRKVKG